MSSPLRVGQVVGGKYRLVRESARSGDLGGVVSAATVFEAEHAWTGKRFTLKVLAAQADDTLEMRFVREARAASALVHANVVKVYDVDRDASGALYQVQELLEGETLADVLRREGRLPVSSTIEWLLPIMDALALAHDVGVVHRDVRPKTIFFARRHDGSTIPKLIDFGVSKLLGANAGTLEHQMTIDNGSSENVAYMSVERVTSDQIDASVDVWAMAVVLYEALTGATPFRTPSFTDMAIAIATRDVPPLASRAPEVPAPIASVIERALLRDRGRRITDMTTLVAQLCHASGHPLPEKSEDLLGAMANVARDRRAQTEPPRVSARAPVHVSRAPVATESRAARLRLGVVGDPDVAVGASTEDRLDRALLVRTAVVRVPTYADLVDALAERRVDLAWLAPMAYARARRVGAVGLFEVARSGPRDPRALLVGRSERVRNLEDLRGARAAWVDPWSTSGYALQRRTLLEHGIELSVLGEQAFLGSHEAVGLALATGRADVGGMVGLYDREHNEVTGAWPPEADVTILSMSERLPSEVIAVGPSWRDDVAALRRALSSAGVPALAGLVGAEVAGELQPVDDVRYELLIE